MADVVAAVGTATDDVQAAERVRLLFAAIPEADRPSPALVDRWVEQLSGPWMRFFLALDPTEILARVKAPILAVNGSLDLQVAAEPNLDAIRRATLGNPDVTTLVLPGLNHLLQQATTGRIEEYGQIEETISPAALDAVSAWILARFSGGGQAARIDRPHAGPEGSRDNQATADGRSPAWAPPKNSSPTISPPPADSATGLRTRRTP